MTRIKECLDRMGQTQKWLAVTMGVKQPSVHDWITGKNKPSTENLKRLAELFGVSADYLLGIDDREQEIKNEPDSDWLDNELLDRFSRLSPENRIRMDAYLQGLLASQEE